VPIIVRAGLMSVGFVFKTTHHLQNPFLTATGMRPRQRPLKSQEVYLTDHLAGWILVQCCTVSGSGGQRYSNFQIKGI